MKQKTIVLSIDSLVAEDLERMKNMPNFSRLFKDAARVNEIYGIYPSLTYPAHVSMMTGCRPGKHGLFTNDEMSLTGGPVRWHYYSRDIQVEDIYAAAKRAGCTTASVFWPVTGCNPNIDWLLNEYFFDGVPLQDPEAAYARMGADEDTLQIVRENEPLLPWNRENAHGQFRVKDEFDDFLMACACGMIRRFQPDLMLIHNCLIDTLRHGCGVFNDAVTFGLAQEDFWLGDLIGAMEDAGTLDNTNFILVSDHGHMNYTRRHHINVLLRREGYIDVDGEEKITDWRAFAQSNGMSSVVLMKDPGDRETYEKLGVFLRNLADEGVWGFTKVYTEPETREKYGTYGEFAYILETDGFTAFGEKWNGPYSVINQTDYHWGKGSHGYEPEKGPQPVFVAVGPAFRPGAILDRAEIIDEAPTIAAIFGQEMPQAEGRCLRELLRS